MPDIKEAFGQTYKGRDPMPAILAAVDYFQTISESEPAVLLGWGLEAYRMLYQKMVAIGDYPNAMKAIKAILELIHAP